MYSIVTGKNDGKVVSRTITIQHDGVEIDLKIDYTNNPQGEVVRCNTYNI